MKKYILLFLICVVISLSGCATFRKAEQADMLEQENKALRDKIEQLMKAKDEAVILITRTKDDELRDLEMAKRLLEEQLKKEIGEYKAKLQMTERGLVITFLAEIFFDSGKDVIREEGKDSLSKVADVLKENVPDCFVAIEGHTDTDPIKFSGWESNWELSSARALAVLHFLINECNVSPERLSAVGYGEYRPVVSNEDADSKKQNRRVEIVILPSQVKKIKDE